MDYVFYGSIYLALAIVSGWCGRQRRIGFWGFLFASIVFTPLISLLFIYFASPKKSVKSAISKSKEALSV
ncbi:hypothetical protein JW960_09135 [candidate division KSB1 bacterium]|nr:hypothetical protein [candidate division KSB1 bacterium]